MTPASADRSVGWDAAEGSTASADSFVPSLVGTLSSGLRGVPLLGSGVAKPWVVESAISAG